MGRILCFDYGAKRVGIAVTDEQRIISSPLETYDTDKIFDFIIFIISQLVLIIIWSKYICSKKPTSSRSSGLVTRRNYIFLIAFKVQMHI